MLLTNNIHGSLSFCNLVRNLMTTFTTVIAEQNCGCLAIYTNKGYRN